MTSTAISISTIRHATTCTRRYTQRRTQRHTQRGAVLILSMILLLVLTLLGLSSMRTATLEEKMAGNMRDRNLAFEATESALREGEAWIARQTDLQQMTAQEFVYDAGDLPTASIQSEDWWDDNPTAVYGAVEQGAAELPNVHTQPEFVVEERAFVPDSLVAGFEPSKGNRIYRVVARGTGATDTAQALAESTYAKRFD